MLIPLHTPSPGLRTTLESLGLIENLTGSRLLSRFSAKMMTTFHSDWWGIIVGPVAQLLGGLVSPHHSD